MKLTSISTILTIIPFLLSVNAGSSLDNSSPLHARADEILDVHYARAEQISQLSTREIVAELEARLERRGAIFDAVVHEANQKVQGVTNKVQGVWKAVIA